MSELLENLPEDWEFSTLGDLNSRKAPTLNPKDFAEETFEYYSIPDFQRDQCPSLMKGGAIQSSKLLLIPQTVLFGKLNPRVEKVWRVAESPEFRQIGSTEWITILPNDRVDADFLYFLEWSDHVMPIAKTLVSGSTPSRQRVDPTSFYRLRVPLPPLPEQKKIAHILSTVQRAIEAQERIIQTTTELKKAIMHKLFTDGLRNEPQKQTEIGPVPKSWEVVTVQDLVDREILDKPIDGNHGEIHPKVSDFVSDGIPFIMASDLKGGLVDLKTCNFLSKERADRLRKGFSLPGDVLISHKATIGETAIVPEVEHYIMLTPQVTYYRVLDHDALSNEYLRCYFDSPTFQKPLKNIAGDGSTRAYIGITKQRSLPVLVPKIDEQREFASISVRFDEKIRQAVGKKKALGQLFRTLLHELMTAKIRINRLEFPENQSTTIKDI